MMAQRWSSSHNCALIIAIKWAKSNLMTHETLKTFGYPQTLVHEYQHWCVLLRPAQVTLGSLVMICKEDATQFGDISPAAFAEMKQVTGDMEHHLKTFRSWEKINYLMLMMVDPHVHFHVIPRYGKIQRFEGCDYPDTGWPAVPQLGDAIKPPADEFAKLLETLKGFWA